MKALREVLIVLVSAVLGFVFGRIGGGSPQSLARFDGAHSSSDAVGRSLIRPSTEDPLAPIFGALLAHGTFRELAQVGALLDKLDSAQMRSLFDRLDRWKGREANTWLPRLIAYWAKRDPEAATERMQPRLASYASDRFFANSFANFDTDFVNAWAKNAPVLAVEFARQHPGTKLAELTLHNAIFSWPDKDESHRFDVLRSFPAGKDRQKVVVSFCFSWAQTDRAGALAAALSLAPGTERDGALGEVLIQWASREPTAALENARTLGIENPAVLAIMAAKAAKSDPDSAVRWLELQDSAVVQPIGNAVVQIWANRDPAAAFAWALANGFSITTTPQSADSMPSDMFAGHAAELRHDTPFSSAIRDKPDATLTWVRSLPSEADRQRYLELTLRATRDVELMKSLLPELSPEAFILGAGRIANTLAIKNPEAAQQWAATLSGQARDEAQAAIDARRQETLLPASGPNQDTVLRSRPTGTGVLEIRPQTLRPRFDSN